MGIVHRAPKAFLRYCELSDRIKAKEKPDEKSISELTELALNVPELLGMLEHMGGGLYSLILKMGMASGEVKAFLTAKVQTLKAELGYQAANPIERLLIDQILKAWVRLRAADANHEAGFNSGGLSVSQAVFHEQFLSNAQRRLTQAIEALARVRNLSRRAPLFQVNHVSISSEAPERHLAALPLAPAKACPRVDGDPKVSGDGTTGSLYGEGVGPAPGSERALRL
jgi:hypothetical protein